MASYRTNLSFEEQFPEIEDILFNDKEPIILMVRVNDVQKHCLSRQRLKDVIAQVEQEHPYYSNVGEIIFEKLEGRNEDEEE